jgi:hypothetical protein
MERLLSGQERGRLEVQQDFDPAREGLRLDRFREAAVKPDRQDLEWDVRRDNVVHAMTAVFRQPSGSFSRVSPC